MSSFRGKILVIRGGAIGDFILTLPVLAALRQQFPDACLEVLGYPHIVELALAGNLVHRVRPIEARALAGFFARHGELADSMADYFAEFDLIISYLYDPDQIFQTNVLRCSPAQFIAGPHRPDEGANTPAAKVFLKPLERLAIFEPDPVPQLHLPTAANSARRLALHPGSGGEKKNWPEARWVELVQALVNETTMELLLVGGEVEGERLQKLAAVAPPQRTQLAQSLPLTELAALLAQCSGFIGHDSGISHLASAVGLRGLILWADTNEQIWRPPSEKICVLRHEQGIQALPVSVVLAQSQRLWPAAFEPSPPAR